MPIDERKKVITSESVTEGHPDKVCDTIADRILDAFLERDSHTRMNIEALAKNDQLVLCGEITSSAEVDIEAIARETIRDIGYTDPDELFNYEDVKILTLITSQAIEIAQGVNRGGNESMEQGAGDQGMMFGYATNETREFMPLPILLSHRITRQLADDRKSGDIKWLRPDGKAQVSMAYSGNKPIRVTDVVVSCQHSESTPSTTCEEYVRSDLLPKTLGEWNAEDIKIYVNPTGSFVKGGPCVDTGLTGRKIIADTYGGIARHGGGSFSGKDASKVDRSGAYYTRFIAKNLVNMGLAEKIEIQVSYAIGIAEPISLFVETFETGDEKVVLDHLKGFDFRPAAIIKTLDLNSPNFHKSTNYGHFGKPELSWEKLISY